MQAHKTLEVMEDFDGIRTRVEWALRPHVGEATANDLASAYAKAATVMRSLSIDLGDVARAAQTVSAMKDMEGEPAEIEKLEQEAATLREEILRLNGKLTIRTSEAASLLESTNALSQRVTELLRERDEAFSLADAEKSRGDDMLNALLRKGREMEDLLRERNDLREERDNRAIAYTRLSKAASDLVTWCDCQELDIAPVRECRDTLSKYGHHVLVGQADQS